MSAFYHVIKEGDIAWIASPNNGGECCASREDTVEELNRLLRERNALASRIAELEDEALAEDPLQDELESARAEIERQLEKIGELVERVEQLESFEQICKDPATLWLQWTRGNVALPEGIGDVRAMEERVKRLEAAGDRLAFVTIPNGNSHVEWTAAKEAK